MGTFFTARSIAALGALGLMFASVGCGNTVAGTEKLAAEAAPTTTPTEPPADDGIKEPPLDEMLKVTGPEVITMPLDGYKSKMDSKEIIVRARNIVATECMRELGYEYWTEGIDLDPVVPSEGDDDDRLNFFDPELAGENGYPKPKIASALPNAATKSLQTNPGFEDAIKAYQGDSSETVKTPSGKSVPQGGCLGQVALAIGGEQPELIADPRDLSINAKNYAMRDSRYAAADAGWKKCMDRMGFSYPNYASARIDPRWAKRQSGEPASAEEKAVAKSDADCQLESNIVGVYKTLRIAYEKQEIKDNYEGLEKSVAIYGVWVENAKKIIG